MHGAFYSDRNGRGGSNRYRPGRVAALLVGALLLLALGSAVAGAATPNENEIGQRLDRFIREMDLLKNPPNELLDQYLTAANQASAQAEDCLKNQQTATDQAVAALKTLGPPTPGEAPEVTAKRKALEKAQTEAEAAAGRCRLIKVKSQDLKNRIAKLQKQRLNQYFRAKGPNLVDLTRTTLADPDGVLSLQSISIPALLGRKGLDLPQLVPAMVFLALGGLIPFWLRRRRRSKASPAGGAASLGHGLLRAVRTTFGRLLPPAAACWAVGYYLAVRQDGSPLYHLLALAAYGAAAYLAMLCVIRTLLAPYRPAAPYLPLSPELSRQLRRRLTVLAALIWIGIIGSAVRSLPGIPLYLALVARDAFAALVIVNLIWAIWVIGGIRQISASGLVRTAISLVLLIALTAEWSGYHNLALYLTRAVLGTLGGLVVALILSRLFTEGYDDLDKGEQPWARTIRGLVRANEGKPVAGLIWLRLFTALMIWGGFIALMVEVWSPVPIRFADVLSALAQGFTVGKVHITPIRVPTALLAFFVLISLTGWLKRDLDRRWLRRAHMERGAREAAVTMIGYFGLGLAVLISLSVAGFELSNLALVAGALSVGIGFGLQNVVNNFVSGLILLFERPIKTGDWIEVGNAQGFVKKISIRSTQIETFDFADVIIPNSELLSGQVTNRMLQNTIGRVRVPLGVAYGSDTQKVKEILLEVAEAHPLVLKSGVLVPQPYVLFLAFGESSLNFELRCYISDVSNTLAVVSDLNFAIDAACRRDGIEIPFPQRDVHVRSWSTTPSEAPRIPPGNSPDRRPGDGPGVSDQ